MQHCRLSSSKESLSAASFDETTLHDDYCNDDFSISSMHVELALTANSLKEAFLSMMKQVGTSTTLSISCLAVYRLPYSWSGLAT